MILFATECETVIVEMLRFSLSAVYTRLQVAAAQAGAAVEIA
jgi:hypothetical protein